MPAPPRRRLGDHRYPVPSPLPSPRRRSGDSGLGDCGARNGSRRVSARHPGAARTMMSETSEPNRPATRPLGDLLADAIALHRADRLREAEPLYAAVMAAERDHPDALHFLGVLKHRQGASEEAVALIRRALALAPSPDAHNNLGNVLLQSGQAEAAVMAYLRVVELRPDDAAAHHNLGIALQAIDRPAEAGMALERAVALEPRQELFHYSSAMLWLRRGDPEMALPLLQVALALDPNFTQAHLARIRAIRMAQPTSALLAMNTW